MAAFLIPLVARLVPWITGARERGGGIVSTLWNARVVTNGLVVALLVPAVVIGGWWVASSAREGERARIAAARKQSTDAVLADLSTYVAARRGEIALSTERLAKINADVRAIIARLPEATIERVTEVHAVAMPTPLPIPITAGVRPPTPQPTPRTVAAYPDEVRSKLDEINVTRRP